MSRRKDRLARIAWAEKKLAEIREADMKRHAAEARCSRLEAEVRSLTRNIEAERDGAIVDIVAYPDQRHILVDVTPSRDDLYVRWPKGQELRARRVCCVELQEMALVLRNGARLRWWMPVER